MNSRLPARKSPFTGTLLWAFSFLIVLALLLAPFQGPAFRRRAAL